MTIDKKEFVKKIRVVMPGIDKNPRGAVLQGADCILFYDNKIFTYNDGIAITAVFPPGLTCAVPAQLLYKTISSFRAEGIDAACTASALILKAGKARAEITLVDEQIMGRYMKVMPEDPQWQSVPENFGEALAHSVFSAHPKLGGVFVNDRGMLATDKVLLSRVELGEPAMDEFWLSLRSAKELLKIDDVTDYCMNSSWIHFKTADVQFSCRHLFATNYPWQQIMAIFDEFSGGNTVFSGKLTAEFRDILAAAKIFCARDDDTTAFVTLDFRAEAVTVRAERSVGRFEEVYEFETNEFEDDMISLATDPPAPAVPILISVVIDIQRVLSVLNSVSEIEFKIVDKKIGTDHNRAVVFKGGDWVQLVNSLVEQRVAD